MVLVIHAEATWPVRLGHKIDVIFRIEVIPESLFFLLHKIEDISNGDLAWVTFLPGRIFQPQIEAFVSIHDHAIDTECPKCCRQEMPSYPVHLRYETGLFSEAKSAHIFCERLKIQNFI